MKADRSPRRRLLSPVAALACCLVVMAGATGLWAGAVIFTPAEEVVPVTDYTTAVARAGAVSASVSLVATAHWTQSPAGTNSAHGTVTTVSHVPGEVADQGEELYTEDLRPVVLVRGAIPAFRDIDGTSEGEDVEQLQELLGDLGYYRGAADGAPGPRTAAAIKEWQKAAGFPVDGVVRRGDLVFVPEVPTRLVVDETLITRGAVVSGGEVVARTLPDEPTFSVTATAAQAAQVGVGVAAEITGPHGPWRAVTAVQEVKAEVGVSIALAGVDGGSVCGGECADLDVTQDTLLPVVLTTTPETSGLTVPTASIRTDVNGDLLVTDSAGEGHRVDVVAAAKGISVVTGLVEGMEVRVYGDDAATR
ncbi:peptidoglycan-binding domain-containing protein [Rathayibacter festucae]|uniref:peptidoglycan-binding domain-containing protein n=1 Tax=Rathayibacter festucae TaxID=110937 RepID=UPI002A6ADA13|nr:peptidoglycan-binding domain-containing protein [Rathayibacter festucae]MDY0913033.1 peptidoglycan-binding domain-containing protein [Rathayibacter festucae]